MIQAAAFIGDEQSCKPLSYAGINRIRFKGSDSKRNHLSSFELPQGLVILSTVLDLTAPVNLNDSSGGRDGARRVGNYFSAPMVTFSLSVSVTVLLLVESYPTALTIVTGSLAAFRSARVMTGPEATVQIRRRNSPER